MATRKPSYSRVPSVSLSKRSSVSSNNSDDLFEEPSDRTDGEAGDGIWNTARRKFTLVALCLVYFAATASFAILSPFFPGEVKLSLILVRNRCAGVRKKDCGKIIPHLASHTVELFQEYKKPSQDHREGL